MFHVFCFGPSQCAWSKTKTHETSTSERMKSGVHALSSWKIYSFFFLKHIMPNDLCLRINDILTRVRFHYLFTHYSWCVCVNSLVQFLPAVRYKYRGQWIIFGLLISASFQKICPIQQYIGQRSTGT